MKCCGVEMLWEVLQGIRVFTEDVKGRKTFRRRCGKCGREATSH
jgi:hypothetical protein